MQHIGIRMVFCMGLLVGVGVSAAAGGVRNSAGPLVWLGSPAHPAMLAVPVYHGNRHCTNVALSKMASFLKIDQKGTK